jgi:dTDP-4-dehydrorhamnose 3,5-epimerase
LKVIRTEIPDVLLLEPKVFSDERGDVFESYNRHAFAESTGVDVEFVQDNHARSLKNVIRGLHYQVGTPQGKLVRAVQGEIFDVAVDLRRSSPAYGRWVSFNLSEENRRMAWIPTGFAHGFLTLSEQSQVLYKMTAFWMPRNDRTLIWNDSNVGVRWPTADSRILSAKDLDGKVWAEAEFFP